MQSICFMHHICPEIVTNCLLLWILNALVAHCLHSCSNIRRDLHFLTILTWFRPTGFTARLHHLLLIQLIFPPATVPGCLFPCYFRGTIKHCGINNGLTSVRLPYILPAESYEKFNGERCCGNAQCEPRCSHQLLDIIHYINDTVRKETCFLNCETLTFCSTFQWDAVNYLDVFLADNTPLIPALWDFNEAEDSSKKKTPLFNYQQGPFSLL